MNDELVFSIQDRYREILVRIADEAIHSGREQDAVRLIVVTKSQPMLVVKAAISAGISRFGENYPEEALEKIAELGGPPLEWHMIGHVQSRKAEMVASKFEMLHSLDSLKLAMRLERFCSSNDLVLPVLLEFNVSGETSKFGFPAWDKDGWSTLDPDIEQILDLNHLAVKGLMTMPPYFDDPENTRPYFRKLRELQGFLEKRFQHASWNELSIGTSSDYIVAIQEGATLLRIGQAILGPRSK